MINVPDRASRAKRRMRIETEGRLQMTRKILVMGLPGAGKTTLARVLAPRLNAVHFNADDVRREINKDLGFTAADRVEQARRMGWLCDQVVKTGCFAVADFICPTAEARAAFEAGGCSFIVWVDRVQQSRFEDTDRIFVPPERYDLHVVAEGLRRVGQVCIAVRDTEGTDGNNPFDFEYARARIEHALREFEGRFLWCRSPMSRMSSMAATSATPWKGSIWIAPCRRFQHPMCAAACPSEQGACEGWAANARMTWQNNCRLPNPLLPKDPSERRSKTRRAAWG